MKINWIILACMVGITVLDTACIYSKNVPSPDAKKKTSSDCGPICTDDLALTDTTCVCQAMTSVRSVHVTLWSVLAISISFSSRGASRL